MTWCWRDGRGGCLFPVRAAGGGETRGGRDQLGLSGAHGGGRPRVQFLRPWVSPGRAVGFGWWGRFPARWPTVVAPAGTRRCGCRRGGLPLWGELRSSGGSPPRFG